MLMQQTVTELLEAFASSDPTPGGGSASALAGAIGVSLLAMVAGMPKTKTGTPEARAALDHARTQLLELRGKLVALVDHDAVAYDLVVTAYRHPKSTDDEKALRKAAIQDAMRVATEVPLETLRAAADGLRVAAVVAEHGNPAAKSDIGVAVELLKTSITGARYNIEINIGSLVDTSIVDRISAQTRDASAHIGLPLSRIMSDAGILELMQGAAARGAILPH